MRATVRRRSPRPWAPLRTALAAAAHLAPAAALAACSSIGSPGSVTGGADAGAGGGGGGGGGDEFVDAAVCDQVEPIEITAVPPPDLLLVVDKSGSMEEPLGTGQQKWQVMRGALIDLVTAYDSGINFGLALYPDDDTCAPGSVRSAIAPQNSSAITTALNATRPDGGTPTHTTLQAALAYYNSIPVNPQGRYVLLATDGQPNCKNIADPTDPAINESIQAITALRNAGIPTYVLGFGDGINSDPTTLQAMANAGGTLTYYAANSPAELQAALDAIAGEINVPSCTFALEEVPEDVGELGVYFDDVPVPRNPSHADGWDYDPATNSITFYGATCDQLQSGSVGEVRVDYGCGGGPIVK
ncbi:MAG: VWA domain-containing protein [Deltaproteobacteria bacterium]|nr:MAG: VWA domain-containing protein [Deltaproteobacteria bacterium]